LSSYSMYIKHINLFKKTQFTGLVLESLTTGGCGCVSI
jgi:hypothetical protein